MKIYTHFSSQSLSNEYIVADDDKNAIIIDPSSLDASIISTIESHQLRILAYVLTGAEASALELFEKVYPAVIYSASNINGKFKYISVENNKVFNIGDLEMHPIFISSRILYKIDKTLFCSDIINSGHIRNKKLIENIKKAILVHSEDTVLYPVYGPISSIKCEKLFNIDL